MALSERTINKHNIKRAVVFKQLGLNVLDVQYAHPKFDGYGHGTCALCDKKHLKWLFSIKFDAPQGLVALAKVMTDIDRDSEVTITPVGSKCINDWLDAVPETAEKLEALTRWHTEMEKCKKAMKERVVEDLCEKAGYDSPQAAYDAWIELQNSYAGRHALRVALTRYEVSRLRRHALRIKHKTSSRVTVKNWLENLQKGIDQFNSHPEVVAPPAPARPASPTPPAPAKTNIKQEITDLLARGTKAWANKDILKPYNQTAFEDIAKKVGKQGYFASLRQKNYYTDLLKKLETAK